MKSDHPLVGIWEQEENPFNTTSVIYEIEVKKDRLVVRGCDEEDGTVLRISRVTWNGKQLCFSSVFPPTNHKAAHAFRLIGRRKARHEVSYSDEDGTFVDEEVWRKGQARSRSAKLLKRPV
jgi:hypothetical protein